MDTLDRVVEALGDAPATAYTAPLVFPWSLGDLESRPLATRPRPVIDQLQLYLHIPFCRYRCSFCFYAIRVGAQREEMERYVAALQRELEWVEPGTPLGRLFIGGGTPSALPPDLLERLLGAVFERVKSSGGSVHTMEASPDSITAEHLRALENAGVRRVSMGVESLDAGVLDTVRRRHGVTQALDACAMIIDHGLLLNVDLIYGLPGQSEEGFRRDIEAAASAGVSSLCLYALRLNEKTPVSKQLDDDERMNLERLMRWREFVTGAAEEAGFVRVRPYYFVRRDQAPSPSPARIANGEMALFGVGMSARSQLGNTMYRNHDRTGAYMRRIAEGDSPVETVFELDESGRKTQFVAATLGNGEALDRAEYERGFGVPVDTDYGDLLERLTEVDLIEDDGAYIALTDTGMLIYDRILLCFYPEWARNWLKNRPARSRRAGSGSVV